MEFATQTRGGFWKRFGVWGLGEDGFRFGGHSRADCAEGGVLDACAVREGGPAGARALVGVAAAGVHRTGRIYVALHLSAGASSDVLRIGVVRFGSHQSGSLVRGLIHLAILPFSPSIGSFPAVLF